MVYIMNTILKAVRVNGLWLSLKAYKTARTEKALMQHKWQGIIIKKRLYA